MAPSGAAVRKPVFQQPAGLRACASAGAPFKPSRGLSGAFPDKVTRFSPIPPQPTWPRAHSPARFPRRPLTHMPRGLAHALFSLNVLSFPNRSERPVRACPEPSRREPPSRPYQLIPPAPPWKSGASAPRQQAKQHRGFSRCGSTTDSKIRRPSSVATSAG